MFKIKKISNYYGDKCFDLLLQNNHDLSYFKKLGWTIKQFKNQFEKENNFALGIYCDNEIKGFVVGNLIFIEKMIEYEILLLYVIPKSRKLGYASKLLKNIPILLKDNKLKKMYLEVAKNNKVAIGMYEKNNFIKKGIRKNYYYLNNIKIDAYFFEKIINE